MEWILDNNCTPYLIIDAEVEGVSVPLEFVKDGQIILNISPSAVPDLNITMEHIMFHGRFNGNAHEISAPMGAVLGIVSKENGEGMWFPREDKQPDPPPDPSSKVKNIRDFKYHPPNLKIIK